MCCGKPTIDVIAMYECHDNDKIEPHNHNEYPLLYAEQKQPGCKKSARPIRSHNGYKRPKTLISSKAKKSNILLESFYLNDIYTIVYRAFSQL